MKFDLTKSKSMWGFGIAILFFIARKILIAKGIVLPEGEWDFIIQFIDGMAVCYGIYGFRDALRKIQSDQYYKDPNNLNRPKVDQELDNLSRVEENFLDEQYRNNENKGKDYYNKTP